MTEPTGAPCVSPPTTSTGAAGSTDAPARAGSPTSFEHRRRRHRAAGSGRRGSEVGGTRRGDRRTARHGMGHGAGAPPASRAVRQRRAQPAADPPSRAIRPVVEDVRAALLPARRHRGRRPHAAPLQRAPGHRIPGAPPPGRPPRRIVHDRRVGQPKIVLGDFNEWMRGLATQMLSERLKSIDLRAHLRRRRTYPGVFPGAAPGSHLLRGESGGCPAGAAANAAGAAASDHLPLVAELTVDIQPESQPSSSYSSSSIGKQPSRRTKRFAEIVDGQVANVKRHHAVCALFFDDHRHRAALDAFAEGQPTAAGESGVREPLQHTGIILQQRLDVLLELLLRCDA